MQVDFILPNKGTIDGISEFIYSLVSEMEAKGIDACVRGLLPRRGTDIVNVQWESTTYDRYLVKRLSSVLKNKKRKVIVELHEVSQNMILPEATLDGIIFHSPEQRDFFCQLFFQDPSTLDHTVISCGRKRFDLPSREELRKEMNIPLDKKILFTGGFVVGKGIELLLRRLLPKMNDDEMLILHIASNIFSEEALEQIYISYKNLERKYQKNLKIISNTLKYVDIHKYAKLSDVNFVYLKQTVDTPNGQSGMALDLVSYGTPTLLPDQRRFRCCETTNVFFENNHPDTFSETLLSLLRGEIKTEKVPEDYKDEKFDIAKVAERHIDYYGKLCNI